MNQQTDNNPQMDWNQRVKIDSGKNRRSMMPIVFVIFAIVVALCLGAYFGLFAGRIIFGGGS